MGQELVPNSGLFVTWEMIMKRHRNYLAKLWERAERGIVYAALSLLLLAELVSKFVPRLKHILDGGGEIVLLTGALLMIFRIIDDRLREREEGIAVGQSFGAAVNLAFQGSKEVNEVILYAFSSASYYVLVRDCNVRIKKLRLILFDPPQVPRTQGNSDADSVERDMVKTEVQKALNNWKQHVASIEYKLCAERPDMHFMIVDGHRGVFGLFGLKEGSFRELLRRTLALSDSNEAGRAMIQNCAAFFEERWSTVGIGGHLEDIPKSTSPLAV